MGLRAAGREGKDGCREIYLSNVDGNLYTPELWFPIGLNGCEVNQSDNVAFNTYCPTFIFPSSVSDCKLPVIEPTYDSGIIGQYY